jgi:hypothetical protein
MWIFLRDSFLSIVAHRDRPGVLLVRARREGDIERVFPEAEIQRTPEADYPFRAALLRDTVESAMRLAVLTIDYDNFKASVEEPGRHDAYLAVWAAARRLQDEGEAT